MSSIKKQKISSNDNSPVSTFASHVYTIGNFHLETTELAMAESISSQTLQEQMTQHCLGTGIYGFVNSDDSNPNTKIYKLNKYVLTKIVLNNPLILEKNIVINGETYSDFGVFTWFSMHLNSLCVELYNTNKNADEDIITNFFEKYGFEKNSNNGWVGIPNLSIGNNDIIWVTNTFLSDYKHLMTLDKKTESYVLMPINYLLYRYGFDGILNKCDDSGRSGSVKYFFNNEYGARGYQPKFKKREPLNGNLIFCFTPELTSTSTSELTSKLTSELTPELTHKPTPELTPELTHKPTPKIS